MLFRTAHTPQSIGFRTKVRYPIISLTDYQRQTGIAKLEPKVDAKHVGYWKILPKFFNF